MEKISTRDIVRRNFKMILVGYIALILAGIYVVLSFWTRMISDREFVFELLFLMGVNLFLYFLLDANIQKLKNRAK